MAKFVDIKKTNVKLPPKVAEALCPLCNGMPGCPGVLKFAAEVIISKENDALLLPWKCPDCHSEGYEARTLIKRGGGGGKFKTHYVLLEHFKPAAAAALMTSLLLAKIKKGGGRHGKQ